MPTKSCSESELLAAGKRVQYAARVFCAGGKVPVCVLAHIQGWLIHLKDENFNIFPRETLLS